MRTLKLTAHLSGEELKERMQQAEIKERYRRWQCLYLTKSYEVTAAYLSDLSGLSTSAVYLLVEQYNHHGPDSVAYKPKGGRHHACLSEQQEQSLLDSLGEKAARGEILTVGDIREEVEQELGYSVSDDYLWGLLKRHQWKKKVPRTKHLKKDVKAEASFKKNQRLRRQGSRPTRGRGQG
jgi:transposase